MSIQSHTTHEAALARARLGLRVLVCKHCYRRPPGSESPGAAAARSCEAGCELFASLPTLLRTARCVDPGVGSYKHAMDSLLHDLAVKAAGNESAAGSFYASPLARYRRRIENVLWTEAAH